MIPIVNIFRGVVDRVNIELAGRLPDLSPSSGVIQYMHGHPLEIITTLKQKDKGVDARFNKYPLIALFQDFPEDHSVQNIGIRCEGTFHLIIAKGTKATYKAHERYEHNFEPFLYPIYEEFMRQIVQERYFQTLNSVDLVPHQKWDRLYWGRAGLYGNEGNVFNDYLDCIEIKNLKLKILTRC